MAETMTITDVGFAGFDNRGFVMKSLAERYKLAVSILENATFSLEDELEKTPIDRRVARDGRKTPSLSDGYAILLGTLRNRQRMNSVVNKGMVEEILYKLEDYNPRVVKRRRRRLQNILDQIDRNVRGDSPIDGERKLWPLFCEGAYSGAVFLARYADWDQFQQHVNSHSKTPEDRWQFARSMGKQIDGMRQVLACSFLKDSGFLQYAKPDTRVLKQIRAATGKSLSKKKAFLLICETAEELGVTPYELDKILWLMETGRPAFMHQAMTEFRRVLRDC